MDALVTVGFIGGALWVVLAIVRLVWSRMLDEAPPASHDQLTQVMGLLGWLSFALVAIGLQNVAVLAALVVLVPARIFAWWSGRDVVVI